MSCIDIGVGLSGRAIYEEGLFAQACQVVDRLVEVEIAGIEPDEDYDLSLIDVAPKAVEPLLYMAKA